MSSFEPVHPAGISDYQFENTVGTLTPGVVTEVDTPCPNGDFPVGGGYYILGSSTPPPDVRVVMDTPYQSVNIGGNPLYTRGWKAMIYNATSDAQSVQVTASCVQVAH